MDTKANGVVLSGGGGIRLEAKLLMRDNDANYTNGFDQVVEAHWATVKLTAIRSPNENAFVERFVQTIQQECLDHFLVFGEKHFDYLSREFVEYYHTERPHQGISNRVPGSGAVSEDAESSRSPALRLDQVECRRRLGGLLKSCRRAAA